jgi:hypothetical protein
VAQRGDVQYVPVIGNGSKGASPAKATLIALAKLTKVTIWFSFFFIAHYHFEWQGNSGSSSNSNDIMATRMRSLLSYGCLAGYVQLTATAFTRWVECVLILWATNSRTAPSTSLALTAKRENLAVFNKNFMMPVLFSVMAVVSVAGIWIHRDDFALL